MKQLNVLYFLFLSNADHYGFFSKLQDSLSMASAELQDAVKALMPDFHTWLQREYALVFWGRKREHTKLIDEAGRKTVHVLREIFIALRITGNVLDQTIVDASWHIRGMLKSYVQESKTPHSRTVNNIRSMLEQLDGPYADDVVTIKLTELVDKLRTAFNEFEDLLRQRGIKPGHREHTIPVVRKQLQDIYHRMAHAINDGSARGESPGFAEFISKLNHEIDRLNKENIRAKHRISAVMIDHIAPQCYTGKPVMPQPHVYCHHHRHGTMTIELGRDYYLTYRNNIKPGTAKCTVRGRGKFSGSKTVTFTINEA
jgi:hypothetical protein